MTVSRLQSSRLAQALDRAPEDALKVSAVVRAVKQTRGISDGELAEVRKLLAKGRTLSSMHDRMYSSLSGTGVIRDRAALDYCRPHLARAIQTAFDGLTPRYRNEAARSNFFKQLAGLCGGLHLSTPETTIGNLNRLDADDPVTQLVRENFERSLADPKSLSQDFRHKAQRLKDEFEGSLDALEEITGSDRKRSERFIPNLSMVSFFEPAMVEDEKSFNWGVFYDESNGYMSLNPAILFVTAVRRGVLAREAALFLTPRIMETVEPSPRVMCEQAEYLAYKIAESKYEREFWFQARHGLRKQTLARADELLDFFHYHEMLVGPALYRELWARLKETGNARITFADYRIIFHTLASRPTPPIFDEKELRLLRLLIRQPDIPAGASAKALGTSIPTTMRLIDDLSRKAGLLFTALIDTRRLGLQEFVLEMKSNEVDALTRIFTRFPYCRQLFRTFGSSDLFAVVDIPVEKKGFISRFVDSLVAKKHLSACLSRPVCRDFQSFSLANFDERLNRWNIHWDTWGLNLREELRAASDSPAYFTEPEPSQITPDKIDMRILDALNADCRKPFADIGRALNVSGAYVGQKVRKMKNSGVFKPALWPLKIGAEDVAMLNLDCSVGVANVMVHYLDQLPSWRGGLVSESLSGLVALVWVPNGELKQLFKAIDDRVVKNGYAERCSFQTLGEWIVGRWLPVGPYPYDLFSEQGRWVFEEDKYLSLTS